jgi:hypothetical protein
MSHEVKYRETDDHVPRDGIARQALELRPCPFVLVPGFYFVVPDPAAYLG